MSQKLLDYYQSELQTLTTEAKSFASKHPIEAQQLGISSHSIQDPTIERLLQGSAFLTARIQQKMAGDFPQISNTLLETLMPTLVKPIPSATVAQCQLQSGVEEVINAKANQHFNCQNHSGDPIMFRNPYAITLTPNKITSISYKAHRQQSKLTIHFEQPILESVDCYINLPTHLATRLCFLLRSESNIQPHYLQPDHCWLPHSPRSLPVYHLINEFFAFPLKMHFFTLNSSTNVVEFTFDNIDEILLDEINNDSISLNCTPLINLFEQEAEPIHINHRQTSYVIQPNYQHKENAMSIYSVDEITAFSEENEPLKLLALFEQPYGSNPNNTIHWQNEANKLSLTYPIKSNVAFDFNYLRAKLTCSNGKLAEQLNPETTELSAPDELSLPLESISLTAAIQPQLIRHQNDRSHWLLISLFSQMRNHTVDPKETLLRVKTLFKSHLSQSSQAYQSIIDGLIKLTVTPKTGRVQSNNHCGITKGFSFNFTVSKKISDKRELIFLGDLLFRYFQQTSSINSFVELVFQTEHTEEIAQWK